MKSRRKKKRQAVGKTKRLKKKPLKCGSKDKGEGEKWTRRLAPERTHAIKCHPTARGICWMDVDLFSLFFFFFFVVSLEIGSRTLFPSSVPSFLGMNQSLGIRCVQVHVGMLQSLALPAIPFQDDHPVSQLNILALLFVFAPCAQSIASLRRHSRVAW